jgi:hypothetical protein
MAKASPKQEVAIRDDDAFAMAEVPDYLKNDTARGSEEVGQKDIALPRLEIVQSESPIKETNPDATDGMLFNSATGEVLGDLIYFVPVYYRMEHLVWKDKDSGGGFFGSFSTADEAQERRVQVIAEERLDEEEIEVVDTPVHYGLRVFPDGSTPQQMVISMAKSKAKVSRKWNAQVQIAGGDRFARVYKITSFKDKNKQGKTFQNFMVQPAGFPTKRDYELAEKTYEIFKQQGMKAAHESAIDADTLAERGSAERGDI